MPEPHIPKMKKLFYSSIFVLILVSSASAQHNEQHHQHKKHLEILIEEYMGLKDALAADNFEEATKFVIAFGDEVKNSSEMNEHKEHAQKHREHHSTMLKAVYAAEGAENIDSLRNAFKAVTTELIKAVENQGYDEKLFVQYCPMEKSRWLSRSEEILNPYFGSAMLRCGNVERVLE